MGEPSLRRKVASKLRRWPSSLHRLRMPQALFGGEIKLRGNVDLQQFFAAAIAQHAHHGIVDFDEAAFGRTEEQAFLNIVEELAVAALGFAAVGNIFQHVNGLQSLVRRSMHAGSGDQIGAVEDGMGELVVVSAMERQNGQE